MPAITNLNTQEITNLAASVTSKEQILSVTDIICEGPIYGLERGSNSIYLNQDTAVDSAYARLPLSQTSAIFTFNGTSVVDIEHPGTLIIQSNTPGAQDSRYLRVVEFDSIGAGSAVKTATTEFDEIEITVPTAFFSSDYLKDSVVSSNGSIQRGPNQPIVRLERDNLVYFEGYITDITSDTVATATPITKTLSPSFVDTEDASTEYKVIIDFSLAISNLQNIDSSNSRIQLESTTSLSGTFNCNIGSLNFVPDLATTTFIDESSKYEKFSYQFRTGLPIQEPIEDPYGGSGATAITTTLNEPFNVDNNHYSTTWPSTEVGTTIIKTASSLGLSNATAPQVNELRLGFTYPSLVVVKEETGELSAGVQAYLVQIELDKGSGFETPINMVDGGGYIVHKGNQRALTFTTETFSLDKYKPFKTFRLKITKVTKDDRSVRADFTYDKVGYNAQLQSTLQNSTCIIREEFSYPWTSYAQVRVSSKNFPDTPTRSYVCKGKLIAVPSNYVTRDESLEGIANYNRNVTTGNIESSYQDWDGNFRQNLVYSNNPAWVFLDLITNARYGLGNWLDTSDIDKYTLYRIARYCDELVPDGKGGLEPRFTSNVYVSKATDAYKILKDFATIFRAMLYWSEGNITPVLDQAKDPIYTFTKGNIINGEFSYQGTSEKLRTNQIVVTWNNPENDYVLEPLIVEDRQNIVKTGKIISSEAVAFGTTSLGQATRYGRWKLWTAINQKEVASFSTSINASFLAPGDIINIQDADRYNTAYSGRVSSTGVLSSSEIPLDREVTLSGNTYELSILIEEPGVFLAQDDAIIGGVGYTKGELIVGSYTEEEAANLVDDSGEAVVTSWSPYTRVESQEIQESNQTTDTLTVSTAFSAAPNAETVWALKETASSGEEIEGSKKLYKILNIQKNDELTYNISAVEHYNEKFDDIEKDFSQPYVDTLLSASPVVPPPTNLIVTKSGELQNKVSLSWESPKNSDNSNYEFIKYYEVHHNLSNATNPLIISSDLTSIGPEVLPLGTYEVGIATISIYGNRSDLVKTKFVVEEVQEPPTVPRGYGIALGGTISTPIFINSTGTFSLENTSKYKFSPVAQPAKEYIFEGGAATRYSQDCSGVASLDYSAMDEVEAQIKRHYIFFDASDVNDPLKLIKYNDTQIETNSLGVSYFYDAGDGSVSGEGSFVTKTGTVSVPAKSTIVSGTGTSFSSEFNIGDLVYFSSTQGAFVQFINSDTSMVLDRSFDSEVAAGSIIKRQPFTFDKITDAAFAAVQNNNEVFQVFPVNLIVSVDTETKLRIADLSMSPSILSFDGEETLVTDYTNIVLTATAEGFAEPKFKITGTGFNNAEISQTAETVFSSANVGATGYEITLDKVSDFSAVPLDFTVTIAEGSDEANTDKQRQKSIRVLSVKNGPNSLLSLSDVTADGTEGQVLTTDGAGTFSFSTVTGGSGGGTEYERTSFTATAGQTLFTVSYEVDFLEVYLNGVLLDPSEYTATNGTSVVLANGTEADDIVSIVSNGVSYVPPASLLDLSDVGSDGIDGQVLTTDGAGSFTFTSASGVTSLLGLTDVASDGTDGQVLSTDGAGSFSFIDSTLLDLTDVTADGTNGQVLTTNGAGSFSFSTIDGSNIQDDSVGLTTLTPSTFNDGTHTVSLVEGGVDIGATGWDTAVYVASADNYSCIAGTFISTGTDATTRGIFAGTKNGTAASFIKSDTANWGVDNDAWLDIAGPDGLIYGGDNSGLNFRVAPDGTVTGTFIGDLTGDVTGNVTGDLTGDVTGNVTGDLTGNADTATKWATPRTITLSGDASGSVVLDGSSNVTLNTTVAGATATSLTGDVFASNGTSKVLENGTDGTNATFTGDVTGDLTGDVTGNVTGDLTGDVTGNVTGDLTGNAATASKWAIARTITLGGDLSGSVSIDGSSNVTLNGVVTGAEATSLTGDVFASNGTSKVLENGTDGTNATFTGDVTGDLTGNTTGIHTGNVTGDLTGNAATASKWAIARTITLGGDLSGSVSIDGSSNVTLNGVVTGAEATSLTGDVFASNGTSKVLENGTDGTNATFTGDVTAGTIEVGGGYGSTGSTLTNTGNGSFNGTLDVDGTFSANGLSALYGSTYIGGGYGSTGITLQSDGTGKFNGNVVVDGSVTCQLLQETSDLTLKENLEVIPNALSKVQSLTGYTYNFIGREEVRTGLIAQDVQSVLPMAVGEHDGKLTLAYGNLIGLLVEAIKELKEEIEELKNT